MHRLRHSKDRADDAQPVRTIPSAATGGKPNRLVILLHGLGADGNDLIGLAPYWAPLLPEAEFLSPNAPFPCDMAPYGYQWFSSQDRSPGAQLAGVRAAAPILDAFIDEALERTRPRRRPPWRWSAFRRAR